ncbi:MAG: MBL fold metallo-hydrolase [Clostridia bacterium]
MRFAVLASGSSGNCIYIESGNQRVLIDAGISNRAIGQKLAKIEIDKEQINSVLITHEHNDHVKGVDVLARHNPHIDIYANENTWKAGEKYFCRVPENQKKYFVNQNNFNIGDLVITPFSISHDAIDPVGYQVDDGKHKIIVATDLGVITKGVFEHLLDADAIILESNHDKNMLINGPYPYFLKTRISSSKGHLANDIAAKLLRKIISRKTQAIVLAHLSEKNNTPNIAYETTYLELNEFGLRPTKDFELEVAAQDDVSRVISLN